MQGIFPGFIQEPQVDFPPNPMLPLDEIIPGDSLMHYPNGGSTPAGEIQYVQVGILAGKIIKAGRTFVETGGGPTKLIRIGLYDQTDPSNPTLGPNTRLRQTAQFASTGNGYFEQLWVDGNITIPLTGYYWIALVQDSNAIRYATTHTFRASFLHVKRETPGATADLPATAGVTTNPGSAVSYAGLVIA